MIAIRHVLFIFKYNRCQKVMSRSWIHFQLWNLKNFLFETFFQATLYCVKFPPEHDPAIKKIQKIWGKLIYGVFHKISFSCYLESSMMDFPNQLPELISVADYVQPKAKNAKIGCKLFFYTTIHPRIRFFSTLQAPYWRRHIAFFKTVHGF